MGDALRWHMHLCKPIASNYLLHYCLADVTIYDMAGISTTFNTPWNSLDPFAVPRPHPCRTSKELLVFLTHTQGNCHVLLGSSYPNFHLQVANNP